MSRVIGRGRYATETYPAPAGTGGVQASIVPLTRQRFIDGGTVQSGRDGSVAHPFLTIAEFIASRDQSTLSDRVNNYVGWVMPAIDGYVANVSLPAHASTELRADSYSFPGTGVSITGNVNWTNLGGVATAGVVQATLHNVSVVGTVQVTDDADSPTAQFIFGADESSFTGAVLTGGFVSNTTVNLLITRSSAGTSGAFTLTITNNADAVLAVIPASSQGFVLAQIPPGGADWVLAQCGAIAD